MADDEKKEPRKIDFETLNKIAENLAAELIKQGYTGDEVILVGFIVQQLGMGVAVGSLLHLHGVMMHGQSNHQTNNPSYG